MNPVIIAQIIAQLGSVGLPLLEKLIADIEAGRTHSTVTAADIAEVNRLAALKASDILASIGVTLPSPTVKAAGVSEPPPDPPEKLN